MITSKLRNEFAGRSSGPVYYENKGDALQSFDAVLSTYGLSLSGSDFVDYNGDNGRAKHQVKSDSGRVVGCAVFSWHMMTSGRYEFIGYLA